MPSLNPYLNFNGNAGEAFEFYKSVFGGEYHAMRFKDMPAEYQGSASEAEKIMHVSLPIGGGSILMGSDIPEQMDKATFGTNFFISINTDTQEEADKIFNGLSSGGQVFMPMADAFWGAYFGMLKDKFNVQWMVNFERRRQQ